VERADTSIRRDQQRYDHLTTHGQLESPLAIQYRTLMRGPRRPGCLASSLSTDAAAGHDRHSVEVPSTFAQTAFHAGTAAVRVSRSGHPRFATRAHGPSRRRQVGGAAMVAGASAVEMFGRQRIARRAMSVTRSRQTSPRGPHPLASMKPLGYSLPHGPCVRDQNYP